MLKIHSLFFTVCGLCAAAVATTATSVASAAEVPVPPPANPLVAGFQTPPDSARLWAYWEWIGGNATKKSITRDLEGMREKGFGGAILFDVDDHGQDGNSAVPIGPMFGSDAWRELYKHTLHEADRLGLSVSLSPQSGWNLGGPFVKPEHAAKLATWSETTVSGPRKITVKLPAPRTVNRFYRDVAVLAFPKKAAHASASKKNFSVAASSSQSEYTPARAVDGNQKTYWVSAGNDPQNPVSPKNPKHFFLRFGKAVSADKLRLYGRPNYGPKDCVLSALADDDKTWVPLKKFTAPETASVDVVFPRISAKQFRLEILTSYDPLHPQTPRNAQIAEITLYNGKNTLTAAVRPAKSLALYPIKISNREFGGSAPDCLPLLLDETETPGEEDAQPEDVRVLKNKVSADGTFVWDVPAGEWTILRFGYTQSGNHVSTSSGKWKGYTLDYLSAEALDTYWKRTIFPLLEDAGPLAGKVLRYIHTDSWECGGMNWTPTFIQEFKKRRGYDPSPFLPVVAGKILKDRKTSNRFLNDFRRTIADCIRDNHYAFLRDTSAKYNIGIHPEAGGPHCGPFDSLQLLGLSDIPMSEFWSWSPRHRVGAANRFFLKQPASAAHVTGKQLVAAEGFTNIGMNWQESFSDNLKPSFDQALCEGMNLLVWHGVCTSPESEGFPGQEYFAGTHFNPNNFVFTQSQDFLNYINRSQFLLQQGLFAADVLEYYGENVPNFTQLKERNTAGSLPGYDYDVTSEEALLTRASVKDGKIVLPDGANYKVLVLPKRDSISLPVLRKVASWVVRDGLTVIGPKPLRITGLDAANGKDAETRALAATLWGDTPTSGAFIRKIGAAGGRVVTGMTARELLQRDNLPPDFERLSGTNKTPKTDSIHRVLYKNQLAKINLKKFSEFSPKDVLTTPADTASGIGAHIYFVANFSAVPDAADFAFRVTGMQPELWDALTGERRDCKAFRQQNGRTIIPLELASYGSVFVVFARPLSGAQNGTAASNVPQTLASIEIDGAWDVSFSTRWGGPEKVSFERLVPWNTHTDPRIRFYSGPAVYRKTVTLPASFLPTAATAAATGAAADVRVVLQLGDVSEIAAVRLNGRSLGTVWARPYQLDITSALRVGANELEIEVVNHWANRVIGDSSLPVSKRLTRTNIRRLTPKTPLVRSGLEGPVLLVRQQR
ncbi:MAG: discoidin domain-containing protein [Puniceicoccales bacterium]|nr:discoidin domain-containing protein [Puniceicoccales bacterium]